MLQKKFEQIILKENELLKLLSEYESFYSAMGHHEHYFISANIINKLVNIQSKHISQQENLLLTYSSLRYIFETLIHSKLMLKEPKHIYRLYYCVYEHQVGKIRRFIKRLKKEIALIDKYVKLEEEGLAKLRSTKNKNKKEIKNILDRMKEDENKMDEEAEKELTIFFGEYKFNGFPLQKRLMENELLPKYLERLAEFEKLKLKTSKLIVNDSRIAPLFNFDGKYTKVFKELIDNRYWFDKAKAVNLEDEYSQMYELSSAILHSTSYSIITPVETEESEKQYVSDLILKYSYEIIKNIELFLDLKRVTKLKVINL
jgi:hypothetical protein